ncbi:MAG TPA: hypothetical protein VFS21_40120 [Roseiflexaceae bacterium]|nr:hypothetical protein [Roseiflexaceae bacterium]
MSDFEQDGERLVIQQPGARLEFVYLADRQLLVVRALVTGRQGNTLSVEGVEVERAGFRLVGPAAVKFWESLNWKPPAAGDDPFEGWEPERLG